MKKGVILFLIYNLYFCSSAATAFAAEPYKTKEIQGISLVTKKSGTVELDGKLIHYSFSYSTEYPDPSKDFNPEMVLAAIKKSWSLTKGFLDKNNISASDCREQITLDFYFLSNKYLFDRARFSRIYIQAMVTSGNVMYGYYDPTPEIVGRPIIAITPMSLSTNGSLIAHEMAHYWWDRLCIAASYRGSNEDFAGQIELLYNYNNLE